jgi:hypothetical protein
MLWIYFFIFKELNHMKIGVLTSGGDSPGMNAAVRASCAKW